MLADRSKYESSIFKSNQIDELSILSFFKIVKYVKNVFFNNFTSIYNEEVNLFIFLRKSTSFQKSGLISLGDRIGDFWDHSFQLVLFFFNFLLFFLIFYFRLFIFVQTMKYFLILVLLEKFFI